ncbi:MAG: sigma-70 family RNA polymerase sigma factor [Xanthomonadales bacterium]|nr:sigma-70 family RNA polymerase sigma factor [Xanthomonadales bacterium]
MLGENIDGILAALSSDTVDDAWKSFIDIYSPTIMQVVYQHESDAGRADECFIFICEKLSDNGFRRLLQFDTHRNARFRSWLALVVSNLCIDWHRREYGRQRPFEAIAKLSALDQLIYHLKYELGMTRRASLRAMQLAYPGLTEEELAESLCKLHTTLTSKQRWQLSMRKRQTGSAVFIDTVGENPAIPEMAQTGPGPEAVAQFLQDRKALEQAMSRLDSEQRLLLRLRYQEELSLKEVARLAGLGDLHQAKRRINKALTTLASLLEDEYSIN